MRYSEPLITRFGARTTLLPGLVLTAASLALFTRAPVDGSYTEHVLPVMILLGLGAGLAFPALMTLAMSGATPDDAGLASGLVNTSAQVGGALGLAVLATLSGSRSESLADGGVERGGGADRRLPPRVRDRSRARRGGGRRRREPARAGEAGRAARGAHRGQARAPRRGLLRGRVADVERMTPARVRAVVLAALAAGAGVVALVLASEHQDARMVWAIFGPAVGWSFVGTGLYAWRKRPESRIGVLMILLGFAWFLSTLPAANSPLALHRGTDRRRALGRRVPAPRRDVPLGPASRTGSTAGW